MKIKELERTANVTWSPQHQYQILLGVGTAAQQLDASFSTNAALEIYSLNLGDTSHDLELVSSVPSKQRFHKLIWGPYGQTNGTIVGGCDGGMIQIYNAYKLLNKEDGLVSCQSKHTGPVKSLDFNPYQNNLLASGASESEISIWDLNNPSTPMTPGSKSQPPEDTTCIAWNKQVQHILASCFSTRCVVWDLRKNEPIIKLTDGTTRIRWNAVAWNPDVATQLCLSSEEDQSPIIQLWDLRFATSPLKILENHQRGVLSISWCPHDSDLLLSCGKDNRILCWNPNSNIPGDELLCEITSSNQWNFDVSWCPRNPNLFVSSSFDGHVSIHSLFGGSQQVQTSNKIADSFPGIDSYTQSVHPQQVQAPVDLRKPPKWLKRPVRASFGFGGKLVTFENNPGTGELPQSRLVTISQVVTEPELIARSSQLEEALHTGHYSDYCKGKTLQCATPHEKSVWEFLAANFESIPRAEFLSLLGFKTEDVNVKLAKFIGKPANARGNDVNHLTDQISALNRNTDAESELEGSDDHTDSRSSYLGPDGMEPSVDRSDSASAAFDLAISGNKQRETHPLKISTADDTDGLICQALLLGNIEAAVELCLQDNRMADAIILAMTGGSELLARTQYRYFQQSSGYLSTLIAAVVTEDWSQVIQTCDLESWKEALAAAITHTSDEEFPVLCELLGERLEASPKEIFSQSAQLCYICAGNINKLVSSWMRFGKTNTANNLQNLVELVMLLKKAVELQGKHVELSGHIADLLSNYASLLASQGSLEAALTYLGTSSEDQVAELRERLYCTLGHKVAYPPSRPQLQRQPSNQLVNQRTRTLSSGVYPASTPPTFQQPPPGQQYQQIPPIQTFNPIQAQPTSVQPVKQQPTPPVFNLNPISAAPNYGNVQPGAAPPVQPPPVTPASLPPRGIHNPSPGPVSGGVSTSRKYVLDPSVQSTPGNPYNNPSYPSSQPSQFPGYNNNTVQQPNIFQAPGSVGPVSNQYVNSTPSNYPVPAPAPTNMSNTGYPNKFNTPSNFASQPTPGGPYPGEIFNPGVNNNSLVQPPPLQNANLSHQHQPPGWNDPPALTGPPKNMQPKTEYTPQNPIVHPLYGAVPDQPPQMGLNGYPNQGYVDNVGMTNSNVYQQQLPQQPQQFPNQFTNQLPPQQNVTRVEKRLATPPPKKPIPEEHIHLQAVLDDLVSRCSMAANNPQSKRKLDDVSRKLEVLYEGLRESRLSNNTLQGLHQIIQYIQAGDYTNGLNLHTQLVSGPDFSQIAGFMPGIKVLLQSALQLQVFL